MDAQTHVCLRFGEPPNFGVYTAAQTRFPLSTVTGGKRIKKKKRDLTLTMRDGWRKKYALEYEVKSGEKANRLPRDP